MLNPKHQRYADRIRELIEEGNALFKHQKTSRHTGSYIANPVAVESWLTKTINILNVTFGKESLQYTQCSYIAKDLENGSQAYKINKIIGLITGALDDLENGFLQGQEFMIAAEVFDSVLEQARHLNTAGYKDPAAVLGRVVIEDALKRLAREESINDNQRAATINQELKAKGKYTQPQWRRADAMLDVGNAAAHGDFNKFTQEDVTGMLDEIEQFLATHFTA